MADLEFLWPSRLHDSPHLSNRQYARIVRGWVTSLGLEPSACGAHSLRRTKAAQIYKKTGKMRCPTAAGTYEDGQHSARPRPQLTNLLVRASVNRGARVLRVRISPSGARHDLMVLSLRSSTADVRYKPNLPSQPKYANKGNVLIIATKRGFLFLRVGQH